MIRKARLYVLLVAVAVLAAPSAQAAAPSNAAPMLTGTVVISGTKTGYVPITVSKDVKLGDPFVTKYRDAVTVTGGGEAAGFALVHDDGDALLLGGRSEAFAPYVKDHGIAVNTLVPRPDDGVTFAVPEGTYRLYLITGGKPTTVRLQFLGAAGSARLAPTVPVESVVQQADLSTAAPGPVGGVYSGGGAVTLTTPVLQFSLARLDTAAHTESVQRYCHYYGKPKGPQPYGPTCAALAEEAPVVVGGGSVFVRSAEGVGPQSFYGWSASLTTSRTRSPIRADLASGISYTTGGVVTSGDYTQFWLSLDPAHE